MVILDIYEDTAGEQRWRLISSNGKILSDSGESYKRQSALYKTIKRIFDDIRNNRIRVNVNGKKTDLTML
jgi:uncharacterized protein YegP (UPF0339 family)